jgi:hypothetical protein
MILSCPICNAVLQTDTRGLSVHLAACSKKITRKSMSSTSRTFRNPLAKIKDRKGKKSRQKAPETAGPSNAAPRVPVDAHNDQPQADVVCYLLATHTADS